MVHIESPASWAGIENDISDLHCGRIYNSDFSFEVFDHALIFISNGRIPTKQICSPRRERA